MSSEATITLLDKNQQVTLRRTVRGTAQELTELIANELLWYVPVGVRDKAGYALTGAKCAFSSTIHTYRLPGIVVTTRDVPPRK